MKIVCLSASQIPSDTANSIQVMKVCQAFGQLGHEVTLIVPGNPRSATISQQTLMAYYGLHTLFPIEWLPVRNRRLFPWVAVRRARALKPDLLYTWLLQSAVFGLLAGMSVMLEMHDCPSSWLGPLWYRLFVHLRGIKRLLPITYALRRVLERDYPALPDGQVLIAPDGVDLERYENLPESESARRQLGLAPGLTVLCTGHLYAGRGADLFLNLASKFPTVNFLWVGGRSQDVADWRGRAAESGLHNVTFSGFVLNELIPLYQVAADILLMPYGRVISVSSGGNTAAICSPMKMFEYMAAGRAILTSDLPVLREVLNESTAVFCPPEDAEAWEFALGGLLRDSERRQTLGLRARSEVSQYSWIARTRLVLGGFDE